MLKALQINHLWFVYGIYLGKEKENCFSQIPVSLYKQPLIYVKIHTHNAVSNIIRILSILSIDTPVVT